MRNQPFRAMLVATVIGAVIPLGGCESLFGSGQGQTFVEPPADGETAYWPFWPRQMRIHPLTRLSGNPDSRDRTLEVRLEFKDQFDFPTKMVGQIRIDLFPQRGIDVEADHDLIWNVDLRDMAKNNSAFDEVTQTYLFRLEIGEMNLEGPIEIVVYAMSNDSRDFQASHRLE
ncbi:MAG: hypothetical protein EA377_13905 [Phycisphaerales bacterium]|nr:MAG: hypothetical protein EA377_13905 [Phycisphaerales bacterium]